MWNSRIFDTIADKSLDSRAQFAYFNIIIGKSNTKKVLFTGNATFYTL